MNKFTLTFLSLTLMSAINITARADAAQNHSDITPAITALSHWYDRITVSGEVDVTGFASDHTPTTIGVIPSNIGKSPQANDLSVTFANLTATAKLNDWIKPLLAISYQQTAPSFIRSPDGGGDSLFVDQVYVTLANPERTPIFLKVGRQFLDFGGLDFSSYLESTTQLLSFMRQTTAVLGVDWKGFTGSLYVFRGLNTVGEPNTTNTNNFGAALGLQKKDEKFGYNIGAGYLSNIVSGLYASSTVANGSPLNHGYYHHAISAIDLHLIANWNAFDASVKYIAALKPFSVLDVPFTTNGGATFSGAKPAAWGLNAGIKFSVMNYKTRFGLGYQGSSESAALGKASGSATYATAGVYGTSFAIGMPRSRFYANYDITLVKWADLGFELAHDQGYSVSNGGTGKGAITGVVALMTHMS